MGKGEQCNPKPSGQELRERAHHREDEFREASSPLPGLVALPFLESPFEGAVLPLAKLESWTGSYRQGGCTSRASTMQGGETGTGTLKLDHTRPDARARHARPSRLANLWPHADLCLLPAGAGGRPDRADPAEAEHAQRFV